MSGPRVIPESIQTLVRISSSTVPPQFASDFNFEDAFARRVICDDDDVSKPEAFCFVRSEVCVGHKQEVVVQLKACLTPAWVSGILSAITSCFVEAFVFGRREPCAVGNFAGGFIGR